MRIKIDGSQNVADLENMIDKMNQLLPSKHRIEFVGKGTDAYLVLEEMI